MKMTKEQILLFAMNRKPSSKGLIYSFEVDEFDKVKITPRGIFSDGEIDENIQINIVPSENRVPAQLEIDEALNNFIDLNGRDSFRLTKDP